MIKGFWLASYRRWNTLTKLPALQYTLKHGVMGKDMERKGEERRQEWHAYLHVVEMEACLKMTNRKILVLTRDEGDGMKLLNTPVCVSAY